MMLVLLSDLLNVYVGLLLCWSAMLGTLLVYIRSRAEKPVKQKNNFFISLFAHWWMADEMGLGRMVWCVRKASKLDSSIYAAISWASAM
jgi:hypothetical protein